MSDEPRGGPGAERLVMFTDAVAAIAMTLLILPLLETISESAGEMSFGALVEEHLSQFGAFVLSFAVIFRLWWAHHRIFESVATIRPAIVRWSLLWTFAIVLLPIPTAVMTAYRPQAGTVGFYGCTLALASGAMTMLALTARRHPELSGDRAPVSRDAVLGNATVFGAQILATAVGVAFAGTVQFYAFLLMFLTGPVEKMIRSRFPEPRAGASAG